LYQLFAIYFVVRWLDDPGSFVEGFCCWQKDGGRSAFSFRSWMPRFGWGWDCCGGSSLAGG